MYGVVTYSEALTMDPQTILEANAALDIRMENEKQVLSGKKK